MKRLITLLSAASVSLAAAGEEADNADLLRFVNGDSLHGTFVEVRQNKVLWKRDGLDPAEFAIDKLRHIALNRGQGHGAMVPDYQVELVNGDLLPGKVIQLTDDALDLETSFAGKISIPRGLIKSFGRIPSNGELVFYGPFKQQKWSILSSLVGSEEEPEKAWNYDGAAFYVSGVSFATPEELRLPDDFELSFRLSARDISVLSVAFFSDKPEFGDEELRTQISESRSSYYGDSRNGDLYGSSLVLDFSGTKAQLVEVIPAEPVEAEPGEEGEDKKADEGEDEKKPVMKPARNRRLGDSASFSTSSRSYDIKATIRASRSLGLIQLLVDGQHCGSWEIDPAEMPQGQLLKFGQRRGRLRLSEISVSEWNRMPDSARSMQAESKDIVVMSSGTDRFSGKIKSITDGKIVIASSFGDLTLDQPKVSKLVLASDGQDKPEDAGEEFPVTLKMPFGSQVSGSIKIGEKGAVFVSRFGSEWPLTTDQVQFIEFDEYDPKLDGWYE